MALRLGRPNLWAAAAGASVESCGHGAVVYIDETGSVGAGAAKQDQLIVVGGEVVDESAVQALTSTMRKVALDHLGWLPANEPIFGTTRPMGLELVR